MKKKIAFLVLLLLLSVNLYSCDNADQNQKVFESYKDYLDYSLVNDEWDYYTQEIDGKTEYVIFYENYREQIDAVSIDIGADESKSILADTIFNKMLRLLKEDANEIIHKDTKNIKINCDYLSPFIDKDSKEWVDWISNTQDGVKLYNIYEFVNNNGYIVWTMNCAEDKNIDKWYQKYCTKYGADFNIIVKFINADVFYKNGKRIDCKTESEYMNMFK